MRVLTLAGFAAAMMFTACAGLAAEPAGAKREREFAEEQRLRAMSPDQKLQALKDEMLAVCQAASPSLNYMKAQRIGDGIYCVHSFFSSHSLKIGPLGPAIEAWGNRRADNLKALKIKRLGVKPPDEAGPYFEFK